MAKKRCIPTDLFYQRKFVALSSDTTRLLLVGLISDADDYGRGSADSHLLGRKLDHTPEVIVQALSELEASGFVQCYGDEERCYALCAWTEWQTLSKPTPSKYPAPPTQAGNPMVSSSQGSPPFSEIPLGNPEKPTELLREGEEELNRTEDEGEENQRATSGKIVVFPAAATSEDERKVQETTRVVARILKLQESEALARLVQEYYQHSHLSLLGEADAAREWIDDRRRNRKGQRMSPSFFRRWLKKEIEAIKRREAELEGQRQGKLTGTDGHGATHPTPSPRTPVASERGMPPSLMGLEMRYRQEMNRGKDE